MRSVRSAEPRPYPWDALPRLAREEVRILARCARRLPMIELARAAASSGDWLGERLGVELVALDVAGALGGSWIDPLCVALLEAESPLGVRIAVDIEPRLAAVVVDRVLGGTGDDAPPHPGALTDTERGVLAYAIARALAPSGGALRLLDVVTTPEAVRVALGERGPWLVLLLRARVGAQVGAVRVWIPERSLAGPARSRTLPRALGSIAVPLAVHAGRAALPAADVASLGRGDIVLLDVASARPGGAGLEGEVVACVRGGSARWRCALERVGIDGARLVVRAFERGPVTSSRRDAGGDGMSEDEERASARLLETAGDVPVELVVELARIELPLAELAALAPGEVLATGRAIGERVLLRAGDRVVATGELVDVEGEIGVRVIALAHS